MGQRNAAAAVAQAEGLLARASAEEGGTGWAGADRHALTSMPGPRPTARSVSTQASGRTP
ncbi:hypothetical protein KWI83_17955 [Streptomyces sp. TRM70350]|nr:hypothetical protein [Streptomyces sp. TRM70350]